MRLDGFHAQVEDALHWLHGRGVFFSSLLGLISGLWVCDVCSVMCFAETEWNATKTWERMALLDISKHKEQFR